MKGMEEAVIKAATTGSYGAALHAFTVNPLIPGGTIAKTVLDELLIAHKDYYHYLKIVLKKLKKHNQKQLKLLKS